MATEESTNTASPVVSTPLVLDTISTAGIFELTIDKGNMVSGDRLLINIYKKATTAGALDILETSYINWFDKDTQQTFAIVSLYQCRFEIEQTAGTARTFPWSIASL